MDSLKTVKAQGAGEHRGIMELPSRDDHNRKALPLDQNQLTSPSFFIPIASVRDITKNSWEENRKRDSSLDSTEAESYAVGFVSGNFTPEAEVSKLTTLNMRAKHLLIIWPSSAQN